MIFPVWQPLASSSHKIAESIGEKLSEETTHTGTLDPMAEGVLVLLTGDDRYAKGNLTDWEKVYKFSILWGIQTDSLDRLGIITQVSSTIPSREQIQSILQQFPSSYEQTVPMYSSMRFEGKSGFDWARVGREIPSKKRLVVVSKIEVIKTELLSWETVQQQHLDSIANVSGDFRQPEILTSWKDQQIPMHRQFVVSHHSVVVSTGTYIRQLVQDIAKEVGILASTWSITRIKNGPYEKQDCVDLDELY